MELTGKQRAQLRAMANELEPIVHIGKDGIGENLVKQANDALEARELIKCRVLDNSMLTAREACDERQPPHPLRAGAGHRHEIRALSRDARQAQGKAHRAREG